MVIELTSYINPLAGRWNTSGKSIINPPNCTILNNSVSENFILADKPFAKVLQIFETSVSVNSNLWGKLTSSVDFQSNLKVQKESKLKN